LNNDHRRQTADCRQRSVVRRRTEKDCDEGNYYFGPIRSAQGMASNQGQLYRAEDVGDGDAE
jgi:hypothetical protein